MILSLAGDDIVACYRESGEEEPSPQPPRQAEDSETSANKETNASNYQSSDILQNAGSISFHLLFKELLYFIDIKRALLYGIQYLGNY